MRHVRDLHTKDGNVPSQGFNNIGFGAVLSLPHKSLSNIFGAIGANGIVVFSEGLQISGTVLTLAKILGGCDFFLIVKLS